MLNRIGEYLDDIKEFEFRHPCIQSDKIFVHENYPMMSTRKLESLKKIAELQRFYQCNPVRFIGDFFGIELFDAQAWIIQRSWTCPNVCIVASRGFGKSYCIDVFLMAKGMLFCNYWSYIASGSGSQAQQTFATLERIANDNIDTMVGSTGKIFKDELIVPNANGDGFSHSVDGFKYTLNNNSSTLTLNSNVDKRRGLRGNVIFDETGWLSAEMLQTYAAFAVVNKQFKTGRDSSGRRLDPVKLATIPNDIPNQKFYISSASSTDTEYYKIYREFSKKMLLGDPDYFVAHLDCEVAFSPTMHGEKIAPLLERATVRNAMKTNPEKGRREYYCEFTSDAGANAIIKRGTITRNSETYKPVLSNTTGKGKYIITYDPARLSDNSVILITELCEDSGHEGVYGKLVNCINLVDVHKKKRTPVTIPEQVQILRGTILDYNLGGDEFYDNIVGVYIDAGAGGQAGAISDLLMKSWVDKRGVKHKGLIDPDYADEDVRSYPDAVVGKLHMMQPTVMKSEMYERMIQMVDEGHIIFTTDYDNKGYLMVIEADTKTYNKQKNILYDKFRANGLAGQELDDKVQEELINSQNAKVKTIRLDREEEIALTNLDLVKDEVVNMVRIKRDKGKDSFELCPEKANTLHDDHSYVLAMAGYVVAMERRSRNKPKREKFKDIGALLASKSKVAKRVSSTLR